MRAAAAYALALLWAGPLLAQEFATWEARAVPAEATAGEASVFELSDDELVSLAESRVREAGVEMTDGTYRDWRRILSGCRREGRLAVTLGAVYVAYEYRMGEAGYDSISLEARGAAVVLLPANAPDWLAEHERGHARIQEGALDQGRVLAAAAFGEYDGREAPTSRELEIRARADAIVPAVLELVHALDEAYDRLSGHKESGDLPEELLRGSGLALGAAAGRSPNPTAISATARGGLARLRGRSDLERWTSSGR